MSPAATGVVGVAVLIMVIMLGLEVGPAMMMVGFLGTGYLVGMDGALGVISIAPYAELWTYSYSVVAMFVLMGSIIYQAGIAEFLYHAAHRWLGHLPGGLGIATVAACGAFASICSSSLATAAMMGKVALPEMDRYNYKKSFSTGIIAAGGTLGIMIPPSTILIVFGFLTETSVGKLFFAAFIPGILEVLLYIGTILIILKFRPNYAATARRAPFREMVKSSLKVWPVLVLFLLVLGGIYFGFFTPTEAGSIGAVGALIISISGRWFSRKKMLSALSDATSTTTMIFFILIGAMIFNYFMAVTRLPYELAEFAITAGLPPYGVLVVMLFIYLVLGCFMDSWAMMLLTVPIFTPVLFSLGFEPLWVGVITVRIIEIALITPPFGMNVFVLKTVAKDVPINQIFMGVLPFVLADLVLLAILVTFPQISLFLPGLMQ